MKDFRDLDVWRKAHRLALAIYEITAGFPKAELYGITSQMRRAASSIAANIAEGCGRKTDADFARFLQNSFGSASELEYYLILAADLGLIKEVQRDRLTNDVVEIKKMLSALTSKLS